MSTPKKTRVDADSVDKDDYRVVPFAHWGANRESEIYKHFALVSCTSPFTALRRRPSGRTTRSRGTAITYASSRGKAAALATTRPVGSGSLAAVATPASTATSSPNTPGSRLPSFATRRTARRATFKRLSRSWSRRALHVYGVQSISKTANPRGALQLWMSTDSGSNAVNAAKAMTDVAGDVQHADLPDLWLWSFCVVHGANLAIQDALKHEAVHALVEKVFSAIGSIRHSRDVKERIDDEEIPRPGRFVKTRWRSALGAIKYIVTHATKLRQAHQDIAFSPSDLANLAVIFGFLQPLDAFILRGQASVAGDAFFLPMCLVHMLSAMKKSTGMRRLVVDSLDTEPLGMNDFGTSLRAWRQNVLAVVEERFFSFETEHFDDIDEDDSDDDGSSDGELDSDGDRAAERVAGLRFKRGNVLMHSAVRAAYGLSPLASIWRFAIDEGAVSGENAEGVAGEDMSDALRIALQIRYATDAEWRQVVADPARGGGGGSPVAGGAGSTTLARLRQQATGTVADPVADAVSALKTFAASPALSTLFIEYLDIEPAKRSLARDKKLLEDWVQLAEKQARWIGRLLRIILIAPLRSTKCESDFSILQHLQAPRRQRMSMRVLAAYMMCKRARAYVTEAPAVKSRTAEGTKDILSFAAPKGAPKPLAQSRISTGASTQEVIHVEADEHDESDSQEEEQDLKLVEVVTRSGRKARTFKAADVVNRILPTIERTPRARR